MNERKVAPPGVLRRIGSIIGGVELTFGVLTLLVILALVFLQAAQRYLPIDQVAWTGEISRFALTWLTFSAAGLLVTTRGHIALEILDSMRNPVAVRIVHVISYAVLAVIGVGLTIAAFKLVESQGILSSPVLRLPMSLVYVPVLVGLFSLTVRAVIMAVDAAINGPILNEFEDDSEVAAA